tara:strand:+ start:433 stop:957 length:525 start_codon:yes stop_codon:yes gene_type:complete
MAITRLGGANAISGTIPQGNIANSSLGAVTALPAAIPTGKVLQVIQTSTSTGVSSTNQTLVDTGLTATITPSSTSSKVFIIVNHGDNDKNLGDCNQRIHLFRGTTFLLEFARNLGNTGDSTEQRIESGCNFLDSPNTTSATTYKTQMSLNGGSGTVTVQASGCTSTMTVMEIAG